MTAAQDPPRLRIGTRASPLALAQAHETRDRLRTAWPDLAGDGAIEIVKIKTTGDHILSRPLSEIGGKGLFTKEIEQALIDQRIDLAVHSMKDVPTVLPEGLDVICYLPREDPRDALFSPKASGLDDLPKGAVIGTCSLRRKAQLLAIRPDLVIRDLRGSVDTRLAKLDQGEFDATLLAMAGINRLGKTDRVTAPCPIDAMLPAVAQGAIGIEIRVDDEATRDRLAPLNCRETEIRVAAERALLRVLDGSCRTPIAALATLAQEPNGSQTVHLTGVFADPDGRWCHRRDGRAAATDAVGLGEDLGYQLKGLEPVAAA